MSNNCKMGLIWKPCPREPFQCKRCYAKMRNSWRTWRLVFPTYPGGIYMEFDTLVPREQSGEAERYLEFDAQSVNVGDPISEVNMIPCTWTNYGQYLFDIRVNPTENYVGNDGMGGYLSSDHWPDWVKEVVPLEYVLRNANRNYRIEDLTFIDAEYDSEGNLLDDAHFRILLYHYLDYYISDPGDGSELHIPIAGVWNGAGANLFYRCYDVDLCPLPDGESMRFTRDLPTEPFVYSGAGGEAGYYQERAPYIFPPYIDGFHVDIVPREVGWPN